MHSFPAGVYRHRHLQSLREEKKKYVSLNQRITYGVTLQAGGIQWTWKDAKNGSYRTFQKERAEEIQKKISNTDLELVVCGQKA